MSNTMIQLVEEVKHTNETVASLDRKVDKMDSRVDEMEMPRKEGAITRESISQCCDRRNRNFFLITGLLYAAVQAFNLIRKRGITLRILSFLLQLVDPIIWESVC